MWYYIPRKCDFMRIYRIHYYIINLAIKARQHYLTKGAILKLYSQSCFHGSGCFLKWYQLFWIMICCFLFKNNNILCVLDTVNLVRPRPTYILIGMKWVGCERERLIAQSSKPIVECAGVRIGPAVPSPWVCKGSDIVLREDIFPCRRPLP